MSQIHALDTATSKQVFVECSNKALKTHDTTIHTKLDTLTTTVTGGTAKTLIVGANDINGGTPHRHLTVDSNGRLLVNPLMTTTNTHLSNIVTNTGVARAQGILMSAVSLGAGTTHGTAIDCRSYKHIRLYGTTAGSQDFFVLGSQDDTNYYVIKNVFPLPSGTRDFDAHFQDAPPYIKIMANGTETITLHYSLLN